MFKDLNKYIKYVLPILVLIFIFIVSGRKSDKDSLTNLNNQEEQKTETLELDTTPNSEIEISYEKIIPGEDLCSQISKEFVTKVTGVSIARMGIINDISITACDYYLTDESNSPYIAIVLNKNLNVKVQKSFVLKQKLVISTDSQIITDHYIVTSPKEDRIVNINLILDLENFIRIDKNVERAIDNEGLIKLAIAISKRL